VRPAGWERVAGLEPKGLDRPVRQIDVGAGTPQPVAELTGDGSGRHVRQRDDPAQARLLVVAGTHAQGRLDHLRVTELERWRQRLQDPRDLALARSASSLRPR
jgi:hypothetical protein